MFRFENHPAALAAWKLLQTLLEEYRIIPDNVRCNRDDQVVCRKRGTRGQELIWFRELRGFTCVVAINYRSSGGGPRCNICYVERRKVWLIDGRAVNQRAMKRAVRSFLRKVARF